MTIEITGKTFSPWTQFGFEKHYAFRQHAHDGSIEEEMKMQHNSTQY
jgi:hypothetical protein